MNIYCVVYMIIKQASNNHKYPFNTYPWRMVVASWARMDSFVSKSLCSFGPLLVWLVVSTPLKNISQLG